MASREVLELIPNIITEVELGKNNLGANTGVICNKCTCEEGRVECSYRNLALEDAYFESIASLKATELDLSGNTMKIFSTLPVLPLKRLNLSRCGISILDKSPFTNLKDLEHLDLSYNELSTSAITRQSLAGPIPENRMMPTPFINITYLSLAYNDIHSLQKDLFIFMMELKSLDLSGNPLVSIDQVTMGALTDLIKLKELRLSACDLESLPDGLLRRQRHLKILDLSNNRFTTVPNVLSESVNLVYLNFNKNLISSIDERTAISNLTKLEELHLSGLTRLQSIGAGALGGLAKLISLHITHNPRLSSLDPNFLVWEDEFGEERWPPIQKLYLNNNNISQINPHYLDKWEDLVAVNFTSNPYMCDCSNQWMVEVLVPTLRRIVNDSDNIMMCRKPLDMRGQPISYLHDTSKQLPCSESLTIDNTSGPSVAIVLGIMIGVFVTFPLVFIVVLLWRNGYFSRCRDRLRSKDVDYDDEETDAF
ncbi:lumican-like [Aphomia sociella]